MDPLNVQGKARKMALKWRGKRDVLLYLATNDFAFPLSTQMKKFQENFDELRKQNVSKSLQQEFITSIEIANDELSKEKSERLLQKEKKARVSVDPIDHDTTISEENTSKIDQNNYKKEKNNLKSMTPNKKKSNESEEVDQDEEEQNEDVEVEEEEEEEEAELDDDVYDENYRKTKHKNKKVSTT